MSRIVRKPAFCKCENKDADQLHGNREADQRICFRYKDSTIRLLSKSSVAVQPGLCRPWSEVGDPDDQFSHNEAHILLVPYRTLLVSSVGEVCIT